MATTSEASAVSRIGVRNGEATSVAIMVAPLGNAASNGLASIV